MAINEPRTSNALGVRIPQWIINQLEKRSSELRAQKETMSPKINDNVLFRGNRTAWVRMVSSIDLIVPKFENNANSIDEKFEGSSQQTTFLTNLKKYVQEKIKDKSALSYFQNTLGLNIKDESDLAKSFILQGGVSKYQSANGTQFSYNLRNGFKESYNVTGTEEEIRKYGYRPMPGITSVRVQTTGKLGSIRSAEIQLKVWDKEQLDIIDALYFKLGYTMLLEWGHTYYYDSNNAELKDTESFSINPFEQGLTKEDIYNKISNNIRESEGNYDAMLGIVTNFNFTYNQEGGYDCTIKLISLGVLISNMKMNNPRILPDLQKDVVKKLYNRLETLQKEFENANNLANQPSNDPGNFNYYPACLRKRFTPQDVVDVSALGKQRLQDHAIKGSVNGVQYFFYRSAVNPEGGDWQTTGYSSRGGWYCDGENLYINEKNVDSSFKTYKEILENSQINRVYAPYNDSILLPVLISSGQLNTNVGKINLDKPYVNKIINGDREYLAFNKFKALVPTNVEKYSVFANIQIPTLTITTSKVNSSGNISTYSVPLNVSNTLLQGSQVYKVNEVGEIDQQNGVTYLLREEPGEEIRNEAGVYSTNYIAVLTYAVRGSGGEIHDYAISVKYDGKINNNTSRKTIEKQEFSTYSGEKKDEIQSKILEALNNTTEPWKITNINESEIPGSLNTDTRVPKIKVTLSKKINLTYKTKEEPTGAAAIDPAGNKIPKSKWNDVDSTFPLTIDIVTNDLGIITSLDIKPSDLQRASDALDQAAQQKSQDTQQGTASSVSESKITLSDIQKSEAEKYKSAFEVIIRIIQLYSLDSAIDNNIEKDKIVKTLSLLEQKTYDVFTKELFSTGLFSKLLGPDNVTGNKRDDIVYYSTQGRSTPMGAGITEVCKSYDEQMSKGTIVDKEFMLKVRALFGFHFGLLGNECTAQDLLNNKAFVDYGLLMTTYTVPYKFNVGVFEGTQLNHPVYLPLGFVIMILNNICTIYNDNKPLVYLDFNHKTNICLSNSKHLSTNPYDVLIPFQGTNEDFISILEPDTLCKAKSDQTGNIVTAIKPIKNKKIEGEASPNQEETEKESATPVYTPKNPAEGENVIKDRISGGLLKFKDLDSVVDPHRGRTMNILISCDYLLKTVGTFAKNNGSGDVYVREFLEQILFDVNKYLGDFNIFRLAYDDKGNSAHIVDDQMTPNLEQRYPQPYETEKNRSKLPIFGIGSIARNLEIRTEVSSRLSNMIAISANSKYEDQSNLSKSAESFGFYNTSYMDRYIPKRTEFKSEVTLPTDTMIRSTVQFNEAIKSFYSSADPADGAVGHATNYYIQRMSKIKTNERGTRASAMIPVSLNFSIDGMSGFGMGQSFTVDQEFLPYTYNLSLTDPFGEQDRVRTVAFVMIGLDHTIEGNQWISNVRSNMIYAKQEQDFQTDEENLKELQKPNKPSGLSSSSTQKNTNFIGQNNEAKLVAEAYLGQTLTDSAWSELVAATFAEASDNQEEIASVMGVILNRVKQNFGNYGSTVYGQLRGQNQFEAVTGANTSRFVKGPSPTYAPTIYGAVERLLPSVPRSYLYFTSANRSLFYDDNGKPIKGRDTKNYDNAVKNYKLIGNSYFG
jgi:hypothetical protein